MSDIIVVGAGVGGLAAALRLQARGHRVTVMEQSGEIGGKLGVIEAEGFRFDTGPSLVTMPHVLADLFESSGVSLADSLPLAR
ncbi:FAD-dependent oxidoreductase, partial [Streptomyces sp. SID10244]|nr:FAD-dependent oxidoreductase [Streptomyces sp. SID10244]